MFCSLPCRPCSVSRRPAWRQQQRHPYRVVEAGYRPFHKPLRLKVLHPGCDFSFTDSTHQAASACISSNQAEAVAATIDAETKTAARLAKRHLGGELTRRIDDWRNQLLQAAAGLEAIIDFPEEVDEDELVESMTILEESLAEMSNLTASYSAGRNLVRGWSVVLSGPVNAGKSTLFNRLLDH